MNAQALVNTTEIIHLPIDIIGSNPYQPRKIFERTHLQELAESIKQYGVMQPISVRYINGAKYELVSGERRLRASKMAGMTTIPAIIVAISDLDSAVLALIENLQREDLNYLEEAEGFANLISDYNFTQEQLAKHVGKSQSTIANKLRILKLPQSVKIMLINNNMSERHARALLRLPDEESQVEILKKVIENDFNVKKTENLIDAFIANDKSSKQSKQHVIKPYIKDLRLFTNTIKDAVDIMNHSGVNTICDIEDNPDGCFISILVSY